MILYSILFVWFAACDYGYLSGGYGLSRRYALCRDAGLPFSFGRAMLGHGARFWVAWSPVFRGEGDAPERRAGRGKLQPNFGFARAHRSEKRDVAFLLFLGAVVTQKNFAAASQARADQNQCTMGVDRKSLGFLFDRFAEGIFAADFHRDLHQNALATASSDRAYGAGGLAHRISLN